MRKASNDNLNPKMVLFDNFIETHKNFFSDLKEMVESEDNKQYFKDKKEEVFELIERYKEDSE
jgi:hypothetical protein